MMEFLREFLRDEGHSVDLSWEINFATFPYKGQKDSSGFCSSIPGPALELQGDPGMAEFPLLFPSKVTSPRFQHHLFPSKALPPSVAQGNGKTGNNIPLLSGALPL